MSRAEQDPVRPVCMYPPGRVPTAGDWAVVEAFGKYLRASKAVSAADAQLLARAWMDVRAQIGLPADRAGSSEAPVPWEKAGPARRAAVVKEAHGWLLAAHYAGLIEHEA